MSKKKQIITILLIGLMAVSFLLVSGCQLPEIEGTIMKFNEGRFDEALATAKMAVDKYPSNAEAWYWLGKCYHEKSMYKEMVDAFNKSKELNPASKFISDIKNIKKREFVNNYNLAIKNLNASSSIEDEQKQLDILKEVSQKLNIAYLCDPDFAMSYILLAKTETKLGNNDEAQKFIDEASQKFSKKDTVLLNIGNYYLENQDQDKALEYYHKANETNPENSDVILALADIYMTKKDYSKAKEYLAIVLEKNPDNVNILFNVAAIYYNLKEYKKAVEHFEKVVNMQSDNKLFWEYYAQSLFNAEMFEKAAEELTRGTQIIKDSKLMYEILAFSYTRLGKIPEAKKAQEMAESISGQ